jgi:uncharacterized radical SAM superfamily Fe-S cluster-containing enzyme
MCVTETRDRMIAKSHEERGSVAVREKFSDPYFTAKGERRAIVPLKRLETLWFNTGTLCNLACRNCYIESSPRNDRLVYLRRGEVRAFLDEARGLAPPPIEIGFTGGEPFMNPDITGMIEDSLTAGFRVLVLTNAMKPMARLKASLLDLKSLFPGRLSIRVSLDHYEAAGHEELRAAQLAANHRRSALASPLRLRRLSRWPHGLGRIRCHDARRLCQAFR